MDPGVPVPSVSGLPEPPPPPPPAEPSGARGADRSRLAPYPSGPSRLAAVVVAGLTLAAGAALAGYAHFSAEPAPPFPVAVSLVVTGPDGEIFNGSVSGRHPLEALLAASAAENFSVKVQSYPQGRYVWSVAGYDAEGECGWLYAVNDLSPREISVAADRYALRAGDEVRWHWGCESILAQS